VQNNYWANTIGISLYNDNLVLDGTLNKEILNNILKVVSGGGLQELNMQKMRYLFTILTVLATCNDGT